MNHGSYEELKAKSGTNIKGYEYARVKNRIKKGCALRTSDNPYDKNCEESQLHARHETFIGIYKWKTVSP